LADVIEPSEVPVEVVSLRKWGCPRMLWPVRSFSYPDFLLYWVGMVISFTGSWAQSLALAWLVLDLTKGPPYIDHQGLYLGLVTACGTVPFLILALPAGVIADRLTKRKITLITQTLAMVQAAVLGALAYYHMIHVWHVLALATFGGTVSAIDVPARQSMTAELVGKEDLVNAVALGSLAFNGARIVGPAIGGVLLYKYGASMCFFVNAISFIAAIAALALIRSPKRIARPKEVRMLPEVVEGFRYVMSNTLVRDLMLMTVIICVFGTQYATVMPIWVKNVLHQDASVLGLIMSLTGLGAALGAITVATIGHKFRQGAITLAGISLLSISLIVFALSPGIHIPFLLPVFKLAGWNSHVFLLPSSINLSVLVMVFVGYGMMLFLSVSNSLIQLAAPDVLRGRVISIRSLMFMGIAPPIGALLIGSLNDHAGPRLAVLLAGVVCLLTGLMFGLSSKAVRRAA